MIELISKPNYFTQQKVNDPFFSPFVRKLSPLR